MSLIWLLIAAVLAVLNWVAVEKKWKRINYLSMPGIMLALLLWLISAAGIRFPVAAFALGLVFSLVGDVLLMIPNGPFLGGLVAFLLALISYIIGFNTTPPPFSLFAMLMAVAVGLAARRIYTRLDQALLQKGQARMRLPVLIYAMAMSLMLLSAFLTGLKEEWGAIPALLASLGALLFFTSDTMLAWDRFVEPLTHRDLKVKVTYHLGQFALIAGVALNYALMK
jgi:uncharacterized membrane protein YhhN